MWISQNRANVSRAKMPEEAKITLGGTCSEASGSYQARGIGQYAPFGYQAALPGGTDVLTVPVPSGRAAVGVVTHPGTLLPGEIKITSESGAYLLFRADGCIVANGLVITPDGTFENRKAGGAV